MKILHFLALFMSFSLIGTHIVAQEQDAQQEVVGEGEQVAQTQQEQGESVNNEMDTETGRQDDIIEGLLIPEDTAGELPPEEKARRKKIREQEALWRNIDYTPYNDSFEKLNEFSKAFSNNQFRLALSNYQSGLNAVVKVREKIKNFRRQESEKIRLNEKWYWQKVDRRDNQERYLARLRDNAKLKAVVYFSRAAQYLDKVRNEELRNRDEYVRLKGDIYRSLIITQYDLKNYTQCIPVLNFYIQIRENEKEYPAHKYLANCYSFQENVLRRNGLAPEDEIYKVKMKKNVHLMRAAELRYGKGSREYRDAVRMIHEDERISLKP